MSHISRGARIGPREVLDGEGQGDRPWALPPSWTPCRHPCGTPCGPSGALPGRAAGPATCPAAVRVCVAGTGSPPTLTTLSEREREVLRLITNGASNQEIADELFVGMNTVKTYIRTAYRKTGVQRRSHAVLWGVRHGLLDPALASRFLPVDGGQGAAPRRAGRLRPVAGGSRPC